MARLERVRNLLESCRDRLKPSDVGLPSTRRRRVPGLRREEVAELAGLSPTWYRLIEVGGRVGSFEVLERVARALRMTADEKAEFVRLANPAVARAVEGQERMKSSGLASLRVVREAIRSMQNAESLRAATTRAADAILEHLTDNSVAGVYVVSFDDDGYTAIYERARCRDAESPVGLHIPRRACHAPFFTDGVPVMHHPTPTYAQVVTASRASKSCSFQLTISGARHTHAYPAAQVMTMFAHDGRNRASYLHPVVQNGKSAVGLAVRCTERAVTAEERAIVNVVQAALTLLAHA